MGISYLCLSKRAYINTPHPIHLSISLFFSPSLMYLSVFFLPLVLFDYTCYFACGVGQDSTSYL